MATFFNFLLSILLEDKKNTYSHMGRGPGDIPAQPLANQEDASYDCHKDRKGLLHHLRSGGGDPSTVPAVSAPNS